MLLDDDKKRRLADAIKAQNSQPAVEVKATANAATAPGVLEVSRQTIAAGLKHAVEIGEITHEISLIDAQTLLVTAKAKLAKEKAMLVEFSRMEKGWLERDRFKKEQYGKGGQQWERGGREINPTPAIKVPTPAKIAKNREVTRELKPERFSLLEVYGGGGGDLPGLVAVIKSGTVVVTGALGSEVSGSWMIHAISPLAVLLKKGKRTRRINLSSSEGGR